jgi:hypothetical protein
VNFTEFPRVLVPVNNGGTISRAVKGETTWNPATHRHEQTRLGLQGLTPAELEHFERAGWLGNIHRWIGKSPDAVLSIESTYTSRGWGLVGHGEVERRRVNGEARLYSDSDLTCIVHPCEQRLTERGKALFAEFTK